MREITLEELLEAGSHFGHQVTRQNPKARDFVFEARDNIHIIDLAKTKEGLEKAAEFVKNVAKKGGSIIVVGTKRQAQGIVKEEVERARKEVLAENQEGGIYYITNRWIGGILTNFSEVVKNFKKLNDIEFRLKSEEEKEKYTKREIGLWEKERVKLESFYGGVKDMKKIPDALFIIDTHNEDLAVKEARRMNVETAGIVDTNADPYLIDYPIPANDDAAGSVKLIISYVTDAWIEGKKAQGKEQKEAVEGKAEEKKEDKKAEVTPEVKKVKKEKPVKSENKEVKETKPKAKAKVKAKK